MEHTHLVKGLDFALLKQVRTDLENKKQQESDDEEEEEEEEEAMDVDEAEQVEQEKKPVFHTLLAKNIVDLFEKQESTLRNELFEPGRMAFAFELADQVGHYSEPFAIPTAVIRSKGEVISRLSKSGWSEDAQSESNLVIDKITQVMAGVRRGDRGISQQPTQKEKKQSKKLIVEPAAAVAVTDDGFMGDIFEDAGREYELSEDVESTTAATSNASKGNYFQGLVKEDDQEDQEMEAVTDEAVTALLAKASKSNIESEPGDEQQEKQPESKKRKYDMTVDADAADIDMFGLSTSALPTSFEDHQTNTTAYQSDDDDQEDKGVQFVDQGTHRNKKAQLTRWDFDNEEEYQKYKDSVEIHPKSAFQFGVKLGDGRKRNRERKGMDEKQRLNRDYQQVKSIMEKKYGQNL